MASKSSPPSSAEATSAAASAYAKWVVIKCGKWVVIKCGKWVVIKCGKWVVIKCGKCGKYASPCLYTPACGASLLSTHDGVPARRAASAWCLPTHARTLHALYSTRLREELLKGEEVRGLHCVWQVEVVVL